MFFLCAVPNCASNHSICGRFLLKVEVKQLSREMFSPWWPICFQCSLWEQQHTWHVYVNFGLCSPCWLSPILLLELLVFREFAGNHISAIRIKLLCSFECMCVNICTRNLCVGGSYLLATFTVYKFNVLIWTLLEEVISLNINITKLIHKLLSLLTADWLYLNCALGCCFALITLADRNSTLSWKA